MSVSTERNGKENLSSKLNQNAQNRHQTTVQMVVVGFTRQSCIACPVWETGIIASESDTLPTETELSRQVGW